MSSDFSGRTPKPLNDPVADVMINDGFFPDLTLLAFQENYRIRSAYRSATIRQKVTHAIFSVNRELIERKTYWQACLLEKHQVLEVDPTWTLLDVDCLALGELHEYTELYKTAVFSLAKAELMRVFDSMNRNDRTENDDDDNEDLHGFINESARAVDELRGVRSEVRGSAH